MATNDQIQDLPEGTAPLGSIHAYSKAHAAQLKKNGNAIEAHLAGLRAVVLLDRQQRAEAAASGHGLSQAARDVLDHRRHQVDSEGWTAAHDDAYLNRELAYAAACYAGPVYANRQDQELGEPPIGWPWPREWWKPTTLRRNLVKSAALSIAEIERIDRAGAE